MNQLFDELMKTLKFYFDKNNKKIDYHNFFFNGHLPSPKDIQFKNITINSITVSWNIDDENLNKDVKNNIQFIVELKKDKNESDKDNINDNEGFDEIYKGKAKECNVNNLICSSNYYFRIKCIIENNNNGNENEKYYINGKWSKKKQRTEEFNIDSNILEQTGKKNEYITKIFEWKNCRNLNLLYRGTRDGIDPLDFYNKCDNQGSNLFLLKKKYI